MKTDVWVVEYSAEQQCFHIDQFSKSLAANRRALEEGRNPGYIPIYIALSSEEAHSLADRWKKEHFIES